MDLPLPDSDAGPDARDRLATLDLPGAGLGALVEAVEFAAATQGTATPRPWRPVRVLLIAGSHAGGAAAGDDPADAERRVAQAEAGEGALARLAGDGRRRHRGGAGRRRPARWRTARCSTPPPSTPRCGRAGSSPTRPPTPAGTRWCSPRAASGTDAAADRGAGRHHRRRAGGGAAPGAACRAASSTTRRGWCAAPRSGTRCTGSGRSRAAPRTSCAELGGADLAVATGALLGAAARRLPVLLDGPVGIAAGLVARDLASQTRHWCLLPDAGTCALVQQGADVLGLTPVLDLGLDLGEGANALAALPLLRTAIGLAAALPVHPALLAEHGDDGLTRRRRRRATRRRTTTRLRRAGGRTAPARPVPTGPATRPPTRGGVVGDGLRLARHHPDRPAAARRPGRPAGRGRRDERRAAGRRAARAGPGRVLLGPARRRRPPWSPPAVTVAAGALLTRGLHLDGLADTVDALGSYRTGAAALEIMKKPDIGPFGVAAIALTLLIQAAALTDGRAGGAVVTGAGRPGRLGVTVACRRGRAGGPARTGWARWSRAPCRSPVAAVVAAAVAAAAVWAVPGRPWQGPVAVAGRARSWCSCCCGTRYAASAASPATCSAPRSSWPPRSPWWLPGAG